ncbi:hypothetical protein PPERSA_11330 [Pseudocohnilembus persalinus]|uniref:PH domain-like protein n=1 Tax=Pseudocohnilembus persalinus TaxID=266149 RepID=A0A0V0QPI9_PSEPJ|nr:hypothetical protein PPERSA_11330 [Pseudocohnilembus persalinus]|eukprot:KRX04206.1 hypothetical protein PPERSA_11330 [Pseudocohnilembus persalinus]
MAYNPPLTNQGLPCKVDGELFVLQRKDMEIEVKIDGNKQWGKKTGRGIMFLTSCRIVFVNDKWQTSEFKAFDIPLANMKKESFEQPVFGSNYLKGNVLPLFNLIPGEAQFKLWFRSGGCGTFLKMCDSVLRQVRRNKNTNRQGPDQRFMADVQSGNLKNQSALFDPNDPTTIYISQPPVPQQNNQQMHNFYGNFQGNNPYYTDNNLSNNNQFNQIQQQPQQQPQFNQPQKQQQPQPFQQQDEFQQYNQNNYQPQNHNYNQNLNQNQQQQYNQIPQGQPANNMPQQYQPYQQGDQFQQYDPSQQQYQNNPNNPQNYQFNQDQLNQQQQLNAPPQVNQQQSKQYFGFWGPNLQQNQQPQQPQYPPQQQNINNQQNNQNHNPSNNYPEF